eukprot:1155879-Pelagomonas_calceolata.AAC.3
MCVCVCAAPACSKPAALQTCAQQRFAANLNCCSADGLPWGGWAGSAAGPSCHLLTCAQQRFAVSLNVLGADGVARLAAQEALHVLKGGPGGVVLGHALNLNLRHT